MDNPPTTTAVTVTTAAPPPATTPNPLNTAHHFISQRLTSRNYLYWRTQIYPFLKGQGFLGYLDGTLPCPPATLGSPTPTDASSSSAVSPPNPAYLAWVQQDQLILSLIISSLSDEVMYLAVGWDTSHAVWDSITAALASSTRSRCLSLLGQFQTLRQGNTTPSEYLGKAQMLVEALSLAGRPLSAEEQILYILRGLRPEFRAMASSLTVADTPVTLPQLADHLQAQEFIHSDDLLPSESAVTPGS